MTSRIAHCLCRLVVVIAAILAFPVLAAETLRMGYFLPGLRNANQADVKAFLHLWSDEVAKPYGIDVSILTYDDMNALYRDAQRGIINMVVAPGMELAETFTADQLADGFAGSHRDQHGGIALIVRNDSGIEEFKDLKGKKVLRLINDRLGVVYLEIQCRKKARSSCADLLNISEEKRDTQSIHKVFFGQANAALVTQTALQAAADMNPQIRQRLRVIDEWKTGARNFGMMLASVPPSDREHVLSAAISIPTSARGKQILELFKVDSMGKVTPDDLNSYWMLQRQYRELIGSAPSKPTKKP